MRPRRGTVHGDIWQHETKFKEKKRQRSAMIYGARREALKICGR